MASAAVDAGLIDGSKTSNEREAALNKLMEQGKLISSQILPYFAKQMRKIANANNGLAYALKNNLLVQLGRADNNINEISNDIYKGLQPAISGLTKSFNEIFGKGNGWVGLGRAIGTTLRVVTFPIVLFIAAIHDAIVVFDRLMDTLGYSDKAKEKLAGLAGSMMGIAVGVWAIGKAYRTLIGILNKGRNLLTMVGLGGAAGTTASTGAKAGAGRAAGLLGGGAVSAGLLAATPILSQAVLLDEARKTEAYKKNVLPSHMDLSAVGRKGLRDSYLAKQAAQKVQVNVNVNDGAVKGLVEAEVQTGLGSEIETAYMNANGGKR